MSIEQQQAAEVAAEASVDVVETDVPAESLASDQAPAPKTADPPATEARSDEPNPSDQDDEGEGAADEPGHDAAAKREPSRVEKRIDKLTRKLRDAERREAARLAEAAYWRGRYEGTGQPGDKGGTGEGAAQANPEPKLDDFDTVEEFADARAEWKQRQKAATTETRGPGPSAGPAEADALAPEIQGRFSKSVADAQDAIPDFADVVFDEDTPISKTMIEAASDDEDPARIIYELAKDPDNVRRIASLSPKQQAREVWRFADQLAAKRATSEPSNDRGRDGAQDATQPQARQQPRAATPSQAAPVPRHLDGSAGTSQVNENNLSDQEWLDLEKRRDRESKRRPW